MGPVSIGGSGGIGKTTTSADSFSTSAGSRNLSASMSQQVADATHQAASSVRNRRATIVKEISETEHEAVSTRILANYNHMHALTVQYFEVIELYRVATGLHEAERCLFVPMKLVDFDVRVITRFQSALADGALNRNAFELLTTDFGMIRLSAARPMRPPLESRRWAFLPRCSRAASASRRGVLVKHRRHRWSPRHQPRNDRRRPRHPLLLLPFHYRRRGSPRRFAGPAALRRRPSSALAASPCCFRAKRISRGSASHLKAPHRRSRA